ncbi:MAG: DUF5685 family protein [Candidatus Marinimicrobia bacterium]|nr:DUF5685 family protein [Candidatus Neomarinimicrobiota bacterium]
MYGFLRPQQCQLSNNERDIYKKHYCGQCSTLQELFGYKYRALVSYDSTFLSLLYSSQNFKENNEVKKYCAVAPKKLKMINPKEDSQIFAACISMLLFSVKINDSLQEKKSIFKLLLRNISQAKIDKANSLLRSLGFSKYFINEGIKKQKNIEKINRNNIIKYAEPTAVFCGELFKFTASVNKIEENEEVLYKIGYNVGLIIYLIDCCIDIIDDIEKEKFNGLIAAYKDDSTIIKKETRSEVSDIVINSIEKIKILTEHLVLRKHNNIIKNILVNGLINTISIRLNKSIKLIEKNDFNLLKYLPHAAIITGLCLITPQEAYAEWIWGETATNGDMVGYGCTCFTECARCCACSEDRGIDAIIKSTTGILQLFDCLFNPCVCFNTFGGDEGGCVYCCQAPKFLLTGLITYSCGSKYGIWEYLQKKIEELEEKNTEREVARKEMRQKYINRKTAELQSLEMYIEELSKKLEIEFPINYVYEIKSFLNAHKNKDIKKISGLLNLIKQKESEAREDKLKLDEAYKLYEKVSNFYNRVAIFVNHQNIIPLIIELDELYAKLNSPNIKSLLTQKKWTDYNKFTNELKDDLAQLNQLAIESQKYSKKNESDQQPEDDGEMTEEKAFSILKLPPKTPNDLIKKMYKSLCTYWHSDKGLAEDDTEMKKINKAYIYLKRIRDIK